MEEKKEIQLDNVLAYEAGKRDAIAEVLSYAEECVKESFTKWGKETIRLDSCEMLYDALFQKFGGKG